jgi:hypothetical protein
MDSASEPDLGVVDALCRMQLEAHRLGCTIRVHDASGPLRDLIALAGLTEVLLAEPQRQPELGEQARVDEGVQADNPRA